MGMGVDAAQRHILVTGKDITELSGQRLVPLVPSIQRELHCDHRRSVVGHEPPKIRLADDDYVPSALLDEPLDGEHLQQCVTV